MNPHSKAAKKNTIQGKEVLSQDTTHFIQRPCRQRGHLCQDQEGNRTTRRLTDHGKDTQTEMVWTCLLLIRSGTVKRVRRQGRQETKWENNIKEWTDLEFAKSQRAVDNREKWRKLALESSVEPQRPLRLRDRWRWRWRNRTTQINAPIVGIEAFVQATDKMIPVRKKNENNKKIEATYICRELLLHGDRVGRC